MKRFDLRAPTKFNTQIFTPISLCKTFVKDLGFVEDFLHNGSYNPHKKLCNCQYDKF